MAALHTALASLSPTAFSDVPNSPPEETAAYLTQAFQNACTVIDSVPLPSPTELPIPRPRSSTLASNASSSSEISASSFRGDPLDPSNVSLQKEWGKPIKLSAKDNPLGMSVYKASGKDGRGAWFARRSVHEGLGFKKWKQGLQQEFPESLERRGEQAGPGDGNIRGIGGERRVERIVAEGVGTVEVYHLSAQFPGPTTPRDFVTLLLTSDAALPDQRKGRNRSRHFMVISRPCDHPDCPPRDGYIRGQYESVEFIREIPREKDRKSMSASNLLSAVKTEEEPANATERDAILRSAMKQSNLSPDDLPVDDINIRPEVKTEAVREGRRRGKTISFAGSRGESAKGERHDNPDAGDDDESNPVEWIMITRSDPGGSVPRFMVERGTPGGIVADASKFLDWACKKEHPEEDAESLQEGGTDHVHVEKQEILHAAELNGHSAGLDGVDGPNETATPDPPMAPKKPAPEATVFKSTSSSGNIDTITKSTPEPIAHPASTSSSGIIDTVAKAAYASLETYAPQVVLDHLPKHSPSTSLSTSLASLRSDESDTTATTPRPPSPTRMPSLSTISSVGTWASAEDHFDPPNDGADTLSTKSSATTPSAKEKAAMTPHEKELAKLQERKRALADKLTKAKEKESKDKAELTSKETERIKKAEEKHAAEVAKQEERYKKEIAKLESKAQKEEQKAAERKKRTEERDERVRLGREMEGVKQRLEGVERERDALRVVVGELQRENTLLVARMGKMEGGEGGGVLREIRAQMGNESGGGRSRSGSLRREGSGGLGEGKKEKEKEKGKENLEVGAK